MDVIFLELLLLHIPSAMLVFYGAVAFQGMQTNPRAVVLVGILAGTTLGIFRNIPGMPGLHVIPQTILMIVLTRYVSGGRWSMTVLGVLIAVLLIGLGEGLITVPFFGLLGYSYEESIASETLLMIGTWISNIPLVIFCLYFYVRRKSRGEEEVAR